MDESVLRSAIETVPAGRWAVGVSGGADSVALLRLLIDRKELFLHVVHLDHETRGEESAGDVEFVADLSRQLGLPFTLGRRSEIEKNILNMPVNPSARFRAARFELFKQVATTHGLLGVILAHHADDQAETILHRLSRGSPFSAVAGMAPRTTIDGLRVVRPLLGVRSNELRDYLNRMGQTWREDSSNGSPKYLRNRLRPILENDADLRDGLLRLGESCIGLGRWVMANTPVLPEQFEVDALASLPPLLARRAASKWLRARGCPIQDISVGVCDQLMAMASDAATPARQDFPGGVSVRRRQKAIFVDPPPAAP